MSPIIDPEYIHKHFPTLANMTYLNNAATGIPPQSTIEVMKEYLSNKLLAKGSFEETIEGFKETKTRLSKLLGGERGNYGFAPSTSGGLNIFAHGIDYPEGSNIVICDLEFPANYVPWQNAARMYNVELRVVKAKNGFVSHDAFAEKIDGNTRVVAASMVQFGSGLRLDIKRLARIAHDNGAYLVTDIIQAAGWQDIDLPKMDVDFAAAQSAKWLIGPIGAGFVYVKKDIIPEINNRFLGWWSVENMHEFGYSERVPLKDARKFECGSPALIAYIGFNESLKVLLEVSSKDRERAALDNADYLRQRLSEIGVEYYDYPPENRSATVSCEPNEVDDLNKNLYNNAIHCSVRNGRLRVSPHYYNSREEIDRLIDHMR